MPAACTARDEYCSIRLVADLLNQRFGHFQRELIFRSHGTESSGHAAAAAVEQLSLTPGQAPGQPAHKSDIHERLGVAMRMDDDFGRFRIERQRVRFAAEERLDELFEQEAAGRDFIEARRT